jgi:hypothetical protein
MHRLAAENPVWVRCARMPDAAMPVVGRDEDFEHRQETPARPVVD